MGRYPRARIDREPNPRTAIWKEVAMKQVRPTVALISVLTAGFMCMPSVAAEPSTLGPAENNAVQPNHSFSADEIQTFAVASLDVERINDQYQSQLRAAEHPDEQVNIAMEAEEQMAQSVEEKGLSIEKYNSIVRAAREDQNLARRILELRGQQTPLLESPEYP
jgi:hypothetical protein